MRVEAIPCLQDNFAYWLPDLGVVIDPSEAAPVLERLAGAKLRAVWCTHHHADHVGGVLELARRFPGLLTIIVPRHPERGAEIETDAAGTGHHRAGRGVMDRGGRALPCLPAVLEVALELLHRGFSRGGWRPMGAGQSAAARAREG